jgi:hypothetical protein
MQIERSIQSKIYEIREQKVMLDFDLAELYETETRTLKQAVKRNIERFPRDFMFQLTDNEVNEMVSQNVIPSKSYFGGALPFAFTEQGVAMLSGILKSKKAVQVNIMVMRAFVLIRQYALNYKDLSDKLQELEQKYNTQFKDVYEALNYLMNEKQKEADFAERNRIGFKK